MTANAPTDQTSVIVEQVQQAIANQRPLSIHGGASHDFLLPGYRLDDAIDMTSHRGIIDYQPSELTVKARAGAALEEIHQALAAERQRFATDIPTLSTHATLGGALAIGHSGSGRPILGALRDHVLGATLVNGRGERIECGGQVMKNVAGYDISRLLSGSRGTLGVILDITLKVLPIPQQRTTLILKMEENPAIEAMNRMAGQSLPITAAVHLDGELYLRLEGSRSGVQQAVNMIGGDQMADDGDWWNSIQHQTHEFFSGERAIWRIVVPTSTPKLELERDHRTLIDWCGGLRWIQANEITQADFIHVSNTGGYIENYRCGEPTDPAALMNPLQRQMHARVKSALDPLGLFNPALARFT